MRPYVPLAVAAVCSIKPPCGQGGVAATSMSAPVGDAGHIDVRQFAHLVEAGDWSPAIQGALGSVSAEKGFTGGATVFLPPGVYRVDRPIVLSGDAGQWGLHLLGYGATLLGTEQLNAYPSSDVEPEERMAANLEDNARRQKAIECVAAARDAEMAGVAVLGRIIPQL